MGFLVYIGAFIMGSFFALVVSFLMGWFDKNIDLPMNEPITKKK